MTPSKPTPEEEALLRGDGRAKLISALVRYILHEEQAEARAQRARKVRA